MIALRSFAIHTLGCKVNQYETEVIVSDLMGRGFFLVDFSDEADVYIINTCTVTGTSDHKSRQWISKAVRRNQDALVVVTGCYAERAKREVKNIPGVDVVVGNGDKDTLGELILQEIGPTILRRETPFRKQHLHTRALIKVVDGCDNFCSYCIVPYVRGKPQSRDLEDVISEILVFTQTGVKEIVLTGVNLGRYGEDLNSPLTLINLLERVEKIPRLVRIRLSSIEVSDLTPDVITLLSSSRKFCRHLHIPLQSGDDRILERMNRHYTTDRYLHAVNQIKQMIPGAAITTDVMVGFPGETEEEFENTKSLVKKVKFRKVHVFKYSDRAQAKASDFSDKVSFGVKERRLKELLDLNQNLAAEFLQGYVGKEVGVLVEKACVDGYLTGLTDNYMRVFCVGDEDVKGDVVKVLIEKREGNSLYGRIV